MFKHLTVPSGSARVIRRQPNSGGGKPHNTFPAADGSKEVPAKRLRMAQKHHETALQNNVAWRALASLLRPCQSPTDALFGHRLAHGLMRSLKTCPSTLINVLPAWSMVGAVSKAMCQSQNLLGAPSTTRKSVICHLFRESAHPRRVEVRHNL
jgi:hypothetical protein